MSLLSGIRFVPKSERESQGVSSAHSESRRRRRDKRERSASSSSESSSSSSDDDESDSDADRRRDRRRANASKGSGAPHHKDSHHSSHKDKHRSAKEKDRKSDRKKEKKSDHKKSSKRHHKHKHKHNRDSGSDESEVDWKAIEAEELEKEKKERELLGGWGTSQRSDAFERFGRGIMEAEVENDERQQREEDAMEDERMNGKEAEPLTIDRFRSLLGSLQHATPSLATPSPQEHQSLPPSAVESESVTNHNAAAALRARLKSGNKSAAAVKSTSSASEPTATGVVDINAQRDLLLLNAQRSLMKSNQSGAGSTVANTKSNKPHASVTDAQGNGDIRSLLGQERFEEDMDSTFRNNLLRLGTRYKGTELGGFADKSGVDEDVEVDMKMFQHREDANADVVQRMQSRLLAAANERKRSQRAMESCAHCVTSSRFHGDHLLAQSENVFVRMKGDRFALSDIHLEIVPIAHVPSFAACDEETQRDIERFKTSVTQLCALHKQKVVFFESALDFARRPHCVIDAVMLTREQWADVPMFAKQAFLTCEEEFSQQRKIVEITDKRPVSRAVPKQFSYLSVEWTVEKELQQSMGASTLRGFVHVVDDDKNIPPSLCFDVVANIVGEDEMRFRKSQSIDRARESQRWTAIGRDWSKVDWTQKTS